jgi:hypothetical protein
MEILDLAEEVSFSVRLHSGDSATEARHHLSAFLAGRPGAEDLVEPSTLVLAELVGNAAVRGADTVRVVAHLEGHLLLLRVLDAIADDDVPPPPPGGGGWGLRIIDELSTRWGVRARLDGRPGSEAWAELDLT